MYVKIPAMMNASYYTPTLLYPNNKQDWKKICAHRKRQTTIVVDTLHDQYEELYAIRHPQSILTGSTRKQIDDFTSHLVAGSKTRDMYGTWVWYPWISTLVHFLPEALHTELRTSRNRNLITSDEQDRFYASHIGVAGLSVGNSVVSSLVHTGGAKNLRLADGDTLSGSNTNRIRAGFHLVGLAKYALIAREVYLVNPYSDISVYPKGLTRDNLEKFLTYPKPLDVVIDEMDTLYLKIQLRLLARKHRIPVIMAADNGDGVVIDIERFDRNGDLPLMHGQVPESELLEISPQTPRVTAAKIISRWVRPENISDRMKESLLSLGKTLYTWPQLGNAAFMAGSLMAYVARKIIVGDQMVEGKIIISPDSFFIPEFMSAESVRQRKKKTRQFTHSIGL